MGVAAEAQVVGRTLHLKDIAVFPRGGDANLYGYVWNNPLKFSDPTGLDGWGNDTADWLDERIEFARRYYQGDVQNWVLNGSVNTGADLAFGFSNFLRVGSGTGQAIYCEDNVYGKAAFIAMDIVGASDIFATLAGPYAVRVGGPSVVTRGGAVTSSAAAPSAVPEASTALRTRFLVNEAGVVNDLQPTLNRIGSGGRFPYRNDGSVFGNREGLLPNQPSGFYREYVHPTPGTRGPGAMRVVTGQNGNIWFTPDHYRNFTRIR